MYADFEVVYYAFSYVNPKAKFRCENRLIMSVMWELRYIYMYVYDKGCVIKFKNEIKNWNNINPNFFLLLLFVI